MIRICAAILAITLVLWVGSARFEIAAADDEPGPFETISVAGQPDIAWTVELASTDEQRATGLMFRKSMKQRHGMLFRFERLQTVSMWMKNTFIPLDMVFMNNSGSITRIHRGAVPESLDIISSGPPARYVLEINAGEADTYNLKAGMQLQHPWFAAN
ncbi:MAG: DUF192 domain-containing protein [Pseudomonadota bacterium]